MSNLKLTLVIGRYAQDWHLDNAKKNLTDTVRAWRDYGDDVFPMPHPSPRNNIWLAKNQWFEEDASGCSSDFVNNIRQVATEIALMQKRSR